MNMLNNDGLGTVEDVISQVNTEHAPEFKYSTLRSWINNSSFPKPIVIAQGRGKGRIGYYPRYFSDVILGVLRKQSDGKLLSEAISSTFEEKEDEVVKFSKYLMEWLHRYDQLNNMYIKRNALSVSIQYFIENTSVAESHQFINDAFAILTKIDNEFAPLFTIFFEETTENKLPLSDTDSLCGGFTFALLHLHYKEKYKTIPFKDILSDLSPIYKKARVTAALNIQTLGYFCVRAETRIFVDETIKILPNLPIIPEKVLDGTYENIQLASKQILESE